MAGEAAAPTAARRTNPTFFMGRRSALILSYAGELVPRTPSKIARRRARDKCFYTQCSFPKCSSICLNIRGVIPSSIRAFPPIKNCVRVSSRVVEGQQVVTCKERTGCSEAAQVASCTATQGHGSRQSAGSFQSKRVGKRDNGVRLRCGPGRDAVRGCVGARAGYIDHLRHGLLRRAALRADRRALGGGGPAPRGVRRRPGRLAPPEGHRPQRVADHCAVGPVWKSIGSWEEMRRDI